jgi:hypothetical protein
MIIPPLGKRKDIHGNKGALHTYTLGNFWECFFRVSKINKLSKLKNQDKSSSLLCACFDLSEGGWCLCSSSPHVAPALLDSSSDYYYDSTEVDMKIWK